VQSLFVNRRSRNATRWSISRRICIDVSPAPDRIDGQCGGDPQGGPTPTRFYYAKNFPTRRMPADYNTVDHTALHLPDGTATAIILGFFPAGPPRRDRMVEIIRPRLAEAGAIDAKSGTHPAVRAPKKSLAAFGHRPPASPPPSGGRTT